MRCHSSCNPTTLAYIYIYINIHTSLSWTHTNADLSLRACGAGYRAGPRSKTSGRGRCWACEGPRKPQMKNTHHRFRTGPQWEYGLGAAEAVHMGQADRNSSELADPEGKQANTKEEGPAPAPGALGNYSSLFRPFSSYNRHNSPSSERAATCRTASKISQGPHPFGFPI